MIKLKSLLEDIKIKQKSGLSGTIIQLLYNDGQGYLDYQEENNQFYLIMIEVKPDFRNKGIATKLLDKFFWIVNKSKGYVDISSYMEDGEKYLKPLMNRFKKKYKNIEWA